MEERLLHICIRRWLERDKRNSVKPTTFDRLLTSYHNFLKYPIAFMDILDLRKDDLQDFVNAMVEDGYSLSTIRKQYHLVSAYLKDALAEGEIQRPIYSRVHLPDDQAVLKKRKDVRGYSAYEQGRLKPVLRSFTRPGYAAALLMMETGMRVGEALALGWEDILWERRAVSIHKTMIRIASRRVMTLQNDAKSYTSNRTIPLSREAMDILQAVRCSAEAKDGFVFRNPDGSPLSYEAMRYQIQQACKDANVPYLGQHAFRHTFATNCYYRGCDVKILSKLLGHSDVTITYNIYIHLFGDALEEMRSVLD